jgi:hypothetical protein
MVLNFRFFWNWIDLIWSYFENYIKDLENRKEKELNKKRVRNGRGEPSGPGQDSAHGPPGLFSRTVMPSHLFLPLTGGPTLSEYSSFSRQSRA